MMKIKESDMKAVLDNLRELSLNFKKIRKELDEVKKRQGSVALESGPILKAKAQKRAVIKNNSDKDSVNSQSTAAILGFIPQDSNVGPQAKYFLCTLLVQVSRKIIAYYNRALSSLGISAQQLIALGVLGFQTDVTLGKFAQSMKISSPSAFKMLKRLEAMKLIIVEPHPFDGRMNIYRPTDKARILFPKVHKKVSEFETFLGSKVGSSNLQRLVADLSNLLSLDLV